MDCVFKVQYYGILLRQQTQSQALFLSMTRKTIGRFPVIPVFDQEFITEPISYHSVLFHSLFQQQLAILVIVVIPSLFCLISKLLDFICLRLWYLNYSGRFRCSSIKTILFI